MNIAETIQELSKLKDRVWRSTSHWEKDTNTLSTAIYHLTQQEKAMPIHRPEEGTHQPYERDDAPYQHNEECKAVIVLSAQSAGLNTARVYLRHLADQMPRMPATADILKRIRVIENDIDNIQRQVESERRRLQPGQQGGLRPRVVHPVDE